MPDRPKPPRRARMILTRAGTVGGLAAATALAIRAIRYLGRPVGNPRVPEPASPVDLERYMGLWYEQFRYDAPFEKGMDEVTAQYSLNANGTVRVINRGRNRHGKWTKRTATAHVADHTTNAKLTVRFFGLLRGKYWVMDHAADYSWAIVGEPSGRFLWALTRDPQPTADLTNHLTTRIQALGYDRSRLRVTRQSL